MILFKLPDLGEGLPDAIIREWYVKVGDVVEKDQPLVAMETAKALVDVPAPYNGKIEKLFGNIGDTIETGKALIGFEGEAEEEPETKDAGTVVGALEEGGEAAFIKPVSLDQQPTTKISATPAVRALARKLNVDLNTITTSGPHITTEDVKRAAAAAPAAKPTALKNMQALSPMQRAMVLSMTQSHQEVVPVSLCDDADITAWDEKQNVTIRLIHAICQACQQIPILNAHFDAKNSGYQLNEEVHLGIAVDTPHGLYVPVIHQANKKSDTDLREIIERFKQQAKDKMIPQKDLHGATIVLSNFGAIAGRYANPIIVPPTVAIIGVGKTQTSIKRDHQQLVDQKLLPLSVTADHRLVTGGEIARFLQVLLKELEKDRE